METIKNLIFDYGGVIIDLDYNRTKIQFKKLGVENLDAHFTQIKQTRLFDDLDTGRISNTDFHAQLNQLLNTKLSDKEIDFAWNAMLIGIKQQKFEVLKELKKQYRTFLLSNTNAIHLKSISDYLIKSHRKENLTEYFDETYYSCEIGLRKPGPEIFLKVLNDNNLNPSETLFIDDSLQHIEGAKKVGLKTFHYNPSIHSLGEIILIT
ncbi:MAG: HAD family phosphatase [Chitinophagales bacterium]|nr:HAD family phosphatase [Chitinophagales bacterium]